MGCDREQALLLPPSLREWLGDDHLVLDVVAEIALGEFYGAHRADGHGRAAHDPAMMVALLHYSYALGQRSSRAIERRCHEHVPTRVICANQAPIPRRSHGSGHVIRTHWPGRSPRCSRCAPGRGWCRSGSSRRTARRRRPPPHSSAADRLPSIQDKASARRRSRLAPANREARAEGTAPVRLNPYHRATTAAWSSFAGSFETVGGGSGAGERRVAFAGDRGAQTCCIRCRGSASSVIAATGCPNRASVLACSVPVSANTPCGNAAAPYAGPRHRSPRVHRRHTSPDGV